MTTVPRPVAAARRPNGSRADERASIGAASADQILVTREVYRRAQSDLAGSQAKAYQLKGFEAPIELYAA